MRVVHKIPQLRFAHNVNALGDFLTDKTDTWNMNPVMNGGWQHAAAIICKGKLTPILHTGPHLAHLMQKAKPCIPLVLFKQNTICISVLSYVVFYSQFIKSQMQWKWHVFSPLCSLWPGLAQNYPHVGFLWIAGRHLLFVACMLKLQFSFRARGVNEQWA